MIRVKICGLTDVACVVAAAEAGADWLGFNFFDRSPRFLTATRAAVLSENVPESLSVVGLFVDPTDAAISETLRAVNLDVLQIYAPVARVTEIRERFGMPVWRSVGVTEAADLPHAANEDAFVIEPRPPAGATRPGGNAVAMDWSVLAGWAPPRPWLLAGGLRPDNVAMAIYASGANAVDVSSGVETAPGIKSPDLIRDFIRRARAPHWPCPGLSGAVESASAAPA